MRMRLTGCSINHSSRESQKVRRQHSRFRPRTDHAVSCVDDGDRWLCLERRGDFGGPVDCIVWICVADTCQPECCEMDRCSHWHSRGRWRCKSPARLSEPPVRPQGNCGEIEPDDIEHSEDNEEVGHIIDPSFKHVDGRKNESRLFTTTMGFLGSYCHGGERIQFPGLV